MDAEDEVALGIRAVDGGGGVEAGRQQLRGLARVGDAGDAPFLPRFL